MRTSLPEWSAAATLILMIVMMFAMVPAAEAAATDSFDLQIPSLPVADAIKILAHQTGHSVLFQTDAVKSIRANAISGRYGLEAAINALLKDTTLIGSLTESGVITIATRDGQQSTGWSVQQRRHGLSSLSIRD